MTGQLERIYTQHRQGLYTLALTITRSADAAEDAVHEAFVRLCRSRQTTSGDPVAYVFAAVRNAAIDQIRQRGRADRQHRSIFADAPPTEPVTPPDEAAAEAERDHLVRQALEALPDATRQIIVMKLYAGLTFDQIAAACGQPLPTIASRYRRGLDKLRSSVEALI
ncbi:RNA polymerase sigma factor [Planctomycetales bacterium ZRK34]|nr:RNA polymerase sigma factor [Planctomycetales bacterium ZRK34]